MRCLYKKISDELYQKNRIEIIAFPNDSYLLGQTFSNKSFRRFYHQPPSPAKCRHNPTKGNKIDSSNTIQYNTIQYNITNKT